MNLTSYMESVQNPKGRFRTLRDVFAVLDNDIPRMTAGMQSIAFEVTIEGVRHVLRCFLLPDSTRDDRLRELSTYTSHIACPHIVPQVFLENEILVFDSSDRAVWADVLIQKIPDGERLDKMTAPPQGIQAGFSKLMEWLTANDFSHGGISPQNIYVMPDGTPVLVDYTRASRRRSEIDLQALGYLAATLNHAPAEPEMSMPKYESIGALHEGVMTAFDGEMWIYIDQTGSQAIPGRFLSVQDFAEGRAVAETETGYGLLDIDGRWIVEPLCDDLSWDCTNNVAILTVDGLSGLANRMGESITGLIYDQILEGNEGFFPVRRDMRYGFLRKDGTMAIGLRFDDAFAFRKGLARVRMGGEYFVIDTKGDIVQKINELV